MLLLPAEFICTGSVVIAQERIEYTFCVTYAASPLSHITSLVMNCIDWIEILFLKYKGSEEIELDLQIKL